MQETLPRKAQRVLTPHLPFNPLSVIGYVFCIEQFVWRRVLAVFVVGVRARVHESLSDDRQVAVDDGGFVDVKNEFGVFDQVHPESQRKAAMK